MGTAGTPVPRAATLLEIAPLVLLSLYNLSPLLVLLLLFFSTCFPTLPRKLCSAWSRSGFDISVEPFGFIRVSPLSLLAQPAHLMPCTSRAARPCSPHLSPPTLQPFPSSLPGATHPHGALVPITHPPRSPPPTSAGKLSQEATVLKLPLLRLSEMASTG